MSSVAIEESRTVTSNSVQYRLTHEWTIKDFAATHLVESPKPNNSSPLYSTLFGSSEDKETQFKLMLRPRGETETDKNCISLYLKMFRDPPSKSLQVKYTFSLLNDRNEECYTKESRTEFTNSSGYPIFLKHAILLDPANGLLFADQLTILAKIDVYTKPVSYFSQEFLLEKLTWEAKENVTKSLGKLLNSEEHHSDVVLVLENSELAAHKNILSLHSPVFGGMFKSESVERIQIADVKHLVAGKMLKFIYTGYVDELYVYAEDLYQAADKYGIARLKELCCQCLCSRVSKDNVTALLAFADLHSVDELKRTCVKFLRDQEMKDAVTTEQPSLVDRLFNGLRQLRLKGKEDKQIAKESTSRNQPTLTKYTRFYNEPWYRLQHRWIIKDFASTFMGKFPEEAGHPKIYSVWFNSSIDKQIQFRLHLKPRGSVKSDDKDFLSLFIEVMKKNSLTEIGMSTEVNFKLSLLNKRNEKYHPQEHRNKFQNSVQSWGYHNFLSHTRLLDRSKGLLPDDQLIIFAEVDVFQEEPEFVLSLGLIQRAARENVASSLGTLLDSGDYSDVVLVVNGEELAAHKNILSANSPVFSAMFKCEMRECEEGRVLISDMEIDVAKVFLRFIYTGDVEDLEMYAQELLMAADKYGITRLKVLCSQYFCGRLDTVNVAAILALADRHSLDQLKKTCVRYISDHLQDIVVNKDWPLIDELFIDELNQLKQKEKEEKIPEESKSSN